MMNGVALFLVLTSLVSAGVWSPSPDQQNRDKKQREEVIVKDGHRVVVVEYEEQQGHHPNTKVSISPEHDGHRKGSSAIANNELSSPSKVSRALDNAMESINEAAASVRGQAQGQGLSKSEGSGEDDHHHYRSPKELICDAYGKCKHKIASALESRTAHDAKEAAQKIIDTKKDIIKGTAHGVKEMSQKVGEVVEEAYDAVSERADVGERARETAHKAKEKVEHAYGKAKDTVEDAYEKTKEMVSDTTEEIKERAKGSVDKAMDAATTAKEMGVTLTGDVQRNVSKLKAVPDHVKEKAKEAKETVEEAAEKAKETVEHATDKVKAEAEAEAEAEDIKDATNRTFSRVFKKGRDVFYGVLSSTGSLFQGFQAVEPLLSGLSLFGFATAYGMSMWITFASSYVLSRVLSPHQFGMVQSKIYKVYFAAMATTVGMALLGHLLQHRKKLTGRNVDALQNYNLMLAELMVLFNMLYLEPRSTKVMFEKMKLEKEEGRGREHVGTGTSTEAEHQPLATEPSTTTPSGVPGGREPEVVQPQVDRRLNEAHQRLKKLNSYSSVLNALSLMALTWHLVYLAEKLQSTCC